LFQGAATPAIDGETVSALEEFLAFASQRDRVWWRGKWTKAGLVDALEESKESVVQGGCVGLAGGAVVAMAVVREEGYGSGGSHAIQVVPVAPEGESEDEVRLGCWGQA